MKGGPLPKKFRPKLDESKLTKGQLRKLNALRKSVGDDIGERAFAEWIEIQPGPEMSVHVGPNTRPT